MNRPSVSFNQADYAPFPATVSQIRLLVAVGLNTYQSSVASAHILVRRTAVPASYLNGVEGKVFLSLCDRVWKKFIE